MIVFLMGLVFLEPPPFPAPMDGRWGYIGSDGTMLIQSQFDDARHFSQGLAAIQINDQWGFINLKGEVVIEPQFDECEAFSEGLAVVRICERYGYIDREGRFVINPRFEYATSFSDGVAIARPRGHKAVVIDQKGAILHAGGWDDIRGFREGLAPARDGRRWGYVDRNGDWVIQPRFSAAESFFEGLALVRLNRVYGYIDTTGKIIVKPQFPLAGQSNSRFSSGLAAMRSQNLWGYIDRAGVFVIEPQFFWAEPFKDGRAMVQIDGVQAYINAQGEIVWRSETE